MYDRHTVDDVEVKWDGSPLSLADIASHDVIATGLRTATPDIPLLSEEGAAVPAGTRATWPRFWLVDPLDGTKEFIARNGEFTVNVALMEVVAGVASPVLGVVHVPVTGTSYLGVRGVGACRITGDACEEIRTASPGRVVHVIASRSHGNAATEAFIDGLADLFSRVERMTSGSSLKLCRVAEGSAHYYPRVAPTMLWDTAAAQAVAEAAGAAVWVYGTRQRLRYDARVRRNPPFLVTYAHDAPLPTSYLPLGKP